jgi:excisionase family DNA binding protein
VPDEMLTTTEVAGMLGIDRHTIARWVREGRLPAIRIRSGCRMIYRIRRRDLAAFVRAYVDVP